jgi:hypothetical protein
VSTFGDHEAGMSTDWLLDDDMIDSIVRGDEVDPHFEPLAAFARQVRALGDEPVPAPSPALRALIARGGTSDSRARRRSRTLARGATPEAGNRTGLRLTAKVGIGAAVATVTMAGAAAAGVLPDRANDAVRNAIEAVTPLDDAEPATEHPTGFGERVSNDATGQSDGDSGVAGGEISDEAPGAAHRPADGQTSGAPNPADRVPGSPATGPDGPLTDLPPASLTVPSTVPDSGGASGAPGPSDAPPGPAAPG